METTFQKNIKVHLEKKKISVAELERRIGLRHAVINIMHGRSKNPSIRVAQAIAKELGCSIEDLLSNESSVKQQVQTILNNTAHEQYHQENHHLLTSNSQPWDLSLAIQSLETVNNYLISNKLNPHSTDVFQCVNEIYRYSYNNNKQIDPVFVNWITEKIFIRNLR
jgi:transcriptional regulator with XRE-family HTH domain